MKRFSIRDVVSAVPGARLLRGDVDVTLSGVGTDSRTITRGDLYVSLSGPRFDGNEFAQDAVSRGAGAVLLRTTRDLLTAPGLQRMLRSMPERLPILLHDSPRAALGQFAAATRAGLRGKVVGITGSCGKTTTKNILTELLRPHLSVVASPHSYNNDVGVPHTLFLADDSTDVVVCEIGTSGPGEIANLCRIAQPDCGILTSIGASHLERLGSVEGVAEEKSALPVSIPPEGFAVLDADCRFTPLIASRCAARVVTFSIDGRAHLVARNVRAHEAGTSFELSGREVVSPLLGEHNVRNLLAALAACLGLGLQLEDVLPSVGDLHGAHRRMERLVLALPGGADVVLYDDSYNANPESTRASLRVLRGMHGHARRVLVLGDMLELGERSAELHHAIGVEAARANLDLLCLVGDLVRATGAGALEAGLSPASVVHVDDASEACRVVPTLLRSGDVALVKASRGVGLDRLVAHLAGESGAERPLAAGLR